MIVLWETATITVEKAISTSAGRYLDCEQGQWEFGKLGVNCTSVVVVLRRERRYCMYCTRMYTYCTVRYSTLVLSEFQYCTECFEVGACKIRRSEA
jgi:hypothetical protein